MPVGDDSEDTDEGRGFCEALYAACLDVTARCDSARASGHIRFKTLCLSDDSHPVVAESFRRLDHGRGQQEAARLCADG